MFADNTSNWENRTGVAICEAYVPRWVNKAWRLKNCKQVQFFVPEYSFTIRYSKFKRRDTAFYWIAFNHHLSSMFTAGSQRLRFRKRFGRTPPGKSFFFSRTQSQERLESKPLFRVWYSPREADLLKKPGVYIKISTGNKRKSKIILYCLTISFSEDSFSFIITHDPACLACGWGRQPKN